MLPVGPTKINVPDKAEMSSSVVEGRSRTRVGFVGNPFLTPVPRGDIASHTLAKSLSLAQSAMCSLHAWTT